MIPFTTWYKEQVWAYIVSNSQTYHASLNDPSLNGCKISVYLVGQPRLRPGLWALEISSLAQSPHEACSWARVGQAQTGLAWLGFRPGPVHHYTQPCTDLNFFPAVCNFLCPKAVQFVHLELRALEWKSKPDELGFNGGKECWALFKSVLQSGVEVLCPRLESLSITVPDGKKSVSLHSSKLIPKQVRRLSLPGYQLVDSSVKHIFQVVSICSPSTNMPGNFGNHPSHCTVTY